MTRLRIGIVGCGLIAQVEHLPNLLALPDRFEVIGVSDPSARVRAHLSQLHAVAAHASAAELLDQRPDCVVIATPDAYHVELAIAALERGINLFVEKPLCYDPADAARVAAARDKAGKIVQVGYMKRFDPASAVLCELLRGQTAALKAVNVDVLDPDFWPFVAHRPAMFGDDVPAELIAENNTKRTAQIVAGLGFAPSRDGMKGYAGPLCSSIVHDVNLVSGALAILNRSIETPIAAALHGADAGVALMARISVEGAPVTMSWHCIPKLAHYSERLSFVFEDAVFELEFPSPYLSHQPTILREWRSTGLALAETVHRSSYAEAFVEEMKSFHAAVTSGVAVVNTVEQAGADIALFAEFGRPALKGGTT